MNKNERETYNKIYEQSKAYWDKRQRALDKSFNKTNKQVLKELRAEYNRIWKDIELEITKKWHNFVNVDPNFKWSELHNLEDTQRAIELLLDELYDIEKSEVLRFLIFKMFSDILIFLNPQKKTCSLVVLWSCSLFFIIFA